MRQKREISVRSLPYKGGEKKEMQDYKIVNVCGHYEAYDKNGNFIVSGDTYREAVNELKILLSNQ